VKPVGSRMARAARSRGTRAWTQPPGADGSRRATLWPRPVARARARSPATIPTRDDGTRSRCAGAAGDAQRISADAAGTLRSALDSVTKRPHPSAALRQKTRVFSGRMGTGADYCACTACKVPSSLHGSISPVYYRQVSMAVRTCRAQIKSISYNFIQ
jgi:hypothetical protein